MKYILPQAKPEWKIKPQTIRELEDAFAQMARCSEQRANIDMNDIRQVERYQFESQSALDKAQNARGAIMLVNYSKPVQEQIDRFKAEDYMSLDALMALSSETREISRLKDFFSSVNTHIKPKDYEERERRQGDFRIVYQRCLDYAKHADDLPVQCRNMIYMMLAQICCNMHAMSTRIDSGYAPGDLFDPIQGYEYASKVERADGAKAFICTRIERQMGQVATGGLSMTAKQFKQKKETKTLHNNRDNGRLGHWSDYCRICIALDCIRGVLFLYGVQNDDFRRDRRSLGWVNPKIRAKLQLRRC